MSEIKTDPSHCLCMSCRHFIPDNGREWSIGRCRFMELVWGQTRYIGNLRDKCKNYHPAAAGTNKGGILE